MNATVQNKGRSGLSILGLFEVACVMGLLATAAAFFARLWWILELMTHFRPHLAVTLLVLAAFWAWRRRRRWAMACGVGCLLNGLVILPHFFAGHAGPTSGSHALKVVSLNVHTANTEHELVLQFLRETDADIVLLMEVNDRWVQKLKAWSASYPHQLVEAREDNFGIAAFSRVPWTNAAVVELGPAGVPSIVADLAVTDRTIQFIGTHPLPPGTASYSAHRNNQLRELAKHASGQTNPVVLAGDLNTTPWSPYFTELLAASGLFDASKGFGVSGSWLASIPVGRIPIDHCLRSPKIGVVGRTLGPNVGSDHLPLIWSLTY